jgi:hypothetical protein
MEGKLKQQGWTIVHPCLFYLACLSISNPNPDSFIRPEVLIRIQSNQPHKTSQSGGGDPF